MRLGRRSSSRCYGAAAARNQIGLLVGALVADVPPKSVIMVMVVAVVCIIIAVDVVVVFVIFVSAPFLPPRAKANISSLRLEVL